LNHPRKISGKSKIFIFLIIVVQLFDIAIHAATDQLELLRVLSNLIILIWVFLLLVNNLRERAKSLALVFIGAYLGINLIFLALEGLTNPNTGALRSMLFVLVILTAALSNALFAREK